MYTSAPIELRLCSLEPRGRLTRRLAADSMTRTVLIPFIMAIIIRGKGSTEPTDLLKSSVVLPKFSRLSTPYNTRNILEQSLASASKSSPTVARDSMNKHKHFFGGDIFNRVHQGGSEVLYVGIESCNRG